MDSGVRAQQSGARGASKAESRLNPPPCPRLMTDLLCPVT